MTLPQLSSANRTVTSSGTLSWGQDAPQIVTNPFDVVLRDLFVHAPHLRDGSEIVGLVHVAQDALLGSSDVYGQLRVSSSVSLSTS